MALKTIQIRLVIALLPCRSLFLRTVGEIWVAFLCLRSSPHVGVAPSMDNTALVRSGRHLPKTGPFILKETSDTLGQILKSETRGHPMARREGEIANTMISGGELCLFRLRKEWKCSFLLIR